MKKRINWVDALKGFGIILVVIGHAGCPNWLVRWIYIFHMPLFFLLSGLMAKESEYLRGGQWIKRKTRSLLWPYLIFGILEFLFDVLKGIVANDLTREHLIKKAVALLYSNYLFEYNYTGVIWFLTCLFVTELIFFLVQRYIQNRAVRIVVVLALGTLGLTWKSFIGFQPPFFSDIALTALIFYSAGYWLRAILNSGSTVHELVYGGLAVAAGSIIGLLNEAGLIDNRVDMLYLRYGNPALFVLSALLCSVGFLLIFHGT